MLSVILSTYLLVKIATVFLARVKISSTEILHSTAMGVNESKRLDFHKSRHKSLIICNRHFRQFFAYIRNEENKYFKKIMNAKREMDVGSAT